MESSKAVASREHASNTCPKVYDRICPPVVGVMGSGCGPETSRHQECSGVLPEAGGPQAILTHSGKEQTPYTSFRQNLQYIRPGASPTLKRSIAKVMERN